MIRAVICASVLGWLAACSAAPLGRDVIAQAKPDGQIAFDVVKVDDRVLATVLAQPQPQFKDRFKQFAPPAEIKIGIGDTVAVTIWEAGSEGLFGESLTELSLPAGAISRSLLSPTPETGTAGTA